MAHPTPGSNDWLNQVMEEIIDPERPIIDPHHHLWKRRFGSDYLLDELWSDIGSGHNVVQTVFMECGAFYLREGPEYLRPLGETRYISELASASATFADRATVAGIIGHADLRLEEPKLFELLGLHQAACKGKFRGIRHAGACDDRPEDLFIPGPAPKGLYRDPAFREGLRLLGSLGYTYDTWHYHHQNSDFIELAQAAPECIVILDHFGTPLGEGIYRNHREDIYRSWKEDMKRLARLPNVYVKLGGLAMPDNGFRWHQGQIPPSSDEIVAKQEQYYLHMIDSFGPGRCMFESNFPVDRLSVSYHVLYNAFKKMTLSFSENEKHALFFGTAEKVYSLAD